MGDNNRVTNTMNGKPFPGCGCASVSTAETSETQVLDKDLGAHSSQEWADSLLSDVPLYLILGHLTRVRGCNWLRAGVLTTHWCR